MRIAHDRRRAYLAARHLKVQSNQIACRSGMGSVDEQPPEAQRHHPGNIALARYLPGDVHALRQADAWIAAILGSRSHPGAPLLARLRLSPSPPTSSVVAEYAT